MIEELEEDIGEIHSKYVRNELATILSRLVLIGAQPAEAVCLVAKIFDISMQEIYAHWENEEEDVR